MNHSNHTPPSSSDANNQGLFTNPITEAPQLALKNRVWNQTSQSNGDPSDIPHQVRLEALKQVGYAWCAGFLDGEGCITLAKVRRDCGHGTNYRVRVHVPQNCRETLLAFRDYVGENCILNKLPLRESYTREVYQLVYDGIHACNLLHKLRPYLVRKGAEADVIFDFYRNTQPTRNFGPKGTPIDIWHARERCYQALRCLK